MSACRTCVRIINQSTCLHKSVEEKDQNYESWSFRNKIYAIVYELAVRLTHSLTVMVQQCAHIIYLYCTYVIAYESGPYSCYVCVCMCVQVCKCHVRKYSDMESAQTLSKSSCEREI